VAGLPGMRVGYAVSASAVAGLFERIRNHFGVKRLV
jgi:histidinol-phosphate/aromatic aminotransferase/cobyric acid decarboxylase-like protein